MRPERLAGNAAGSGVEQLRSQPPQASEVHAVEILDSVAGHLRAAKASLIRAGIELAKIPIPAEKGMKLLVMVKNLDQLQAWFEGTDAEACELRAVRPKGRRRTRLQKKIDQSHPADNQPEQPATSQPASSEGLPLPRGSKIVG